MKIQITITVERLNKAIQSEKEFRDEDGKAMVAYLKEFAIESFPGKWQYNAVVTKVKVNKGLK